METNIEEKNTATLICGQFECEPVDDDHAALRKATEERYISDDEEEFYDTVESHTLLLTCEHDELRCGVHKVLADFVKSEKKQTLLVKENDDSCDTKSNLKSDQKIELKVDQEQNELVCAQCLDKNNILLEETCQLCDINLCFICSNDHDCSSFNNRVQSTIPECEPCKFRGNNNNAVVKCVQCNEGLCDTCKSFHLSQKATRSHMFTNISVYNEINCDCCLGRCEQKIPATGRCFECDEHFCDECRLVHLSQKATAQHKIVNSTMPEQRRKSFDSIKLADDGLTTHSATIKDMTSAAPDMLETHTVTDRPEFQPGKPHASDVTIDNITLNWERPALLLDDYKYQIRYKTVESGHGTDNWIYYDEKPTKASVILKGLDSDTCYIFQVRMIQGGREECLSDTSDVIRTKKSAASSVVEFSQDIHMPNVAIPVKKIPMHQDTSARNNNAKTRKFDIGNKPAKCNKEKTILLVGATGSGKSTLIDGMINYIFGVTWNDSYRLSMIDLETEETNIQHNQAQSQTQWITNYTVHPVSGSRLNYTLNIIDTPGFGDTRGIQRDKEVFEQIRVLFTATDSTGIVHLDAVCFFIKAPDARLTASQRYVFDSILSVFGKDIKENICVFVTFADGKRPPVISALKEADLPNELLFTFNNSGLFADNTGSEMSTMSPLFWEMGVKGFESFFKYLVTLETKSLGQTKEVLAERKVVELTVENLLPTVEIGLHKLEELRLEIQILTEHEKDIKANKNFTYEVQETHQKKHDLPAGIHVTNCLHCNVTCHIKCKISEDDQKFRCWAMDKITGKCTQCPQKCHWKQHANTPYIFEYEVVPVTKTYTENLKKYRQAKSEKITHEQVIDRMVKELDSHEHDILEKIEKINKCNNRLKEIALRPNPLETSGYIDILIESEKAEMNSGFHVRIAALNDLKNKANVKDNVTKFCDSFSDARKSVLTYKVVDSSKLGKKGNLIKKAIQSICQ